MVDEARPTSESSANDVREPAPELAEEARVGQSPEGRSANLFLLALSRAARSFLLYEPTNDAIRRFIGDLQAKLKEAVAQIGTLDFEVQPFELRLHDEAVYVETDRERSLAFRMFRDGVRRIVIHDEVTWEEILRLLEVLSVRYTGVRQNEDDLVTLLWKAGFEHIDVDAVEGFVPEDDGSAQAVVGRRRAELDIPPDWDLPSRALEGHGSLEYQPLSEEALKALVGEEASHLLPGSAVRAVVELLELAAEPESDVAIDDIVPFIGEVRDFLLAEGQLGHLTAVVRACQMTFARSPERVAPIVSAFGDKQALAKILHSTPRGTVHPPEELLELLDLLPTDRLSHLVDLVVEERGEAGRRLTRQLIERYAADQPDYIVARMRTAEPSVICDLLRACSNVMPDRAIDAAIEMAHHRDPDVIHEVLLRFEEAPGGAKVSRALLKMLDAPDEEVRLKVWTLLAGRREHAAFAPLTRYIEQRAQSGLTSTEAELAGRTVAQLAPSSALAVFKEWLRPKGLIGRWVETPAHLSLTSVTIAGLAVLPGDEPERMIRELAERSQDELKHHCLAALGRRRREAG
jgi:hypothetical protein